MNNLIPTPQLTTPYPGAFRLPEGEVLGIQAHGSAGHFARDWLATCLRRDLQVETGPAQGEPTVHLGLLDDLMPHGLADVSWRSSRAFAAREGSEQGYVLDVNPRSMVLGALTEQGLLHGAATARQLLRREGGELVAPCGRIEDWPDFRFRVGADWLLNVEINRWGYERGDGREALVARLERKLDLAARYKINVVWFDGFGWSPDRFPGYADFARHLSDYARARHIRLAHAGYGGGYGFAYQKSPIYHAPYQGQTFQNRTRYPDGEAYDCVGHPYYATSWRYGTCLSNATLTKLKLAELGPFVRSCRPGLLYVHDVDTGDFEIAREGWQRRCAGCRERWPDDEMASDRGAAAAYASWFRQVATAVNAVQDEDYVAARDCEIVFVGPVYTGCHEPDSVWMAECDYFAAVSQHLGPLPNVQFGIREQFVVDEPAGLRTAMLKHRLEAVGHGHGVFVIAFVGGDNYCNDQLVSAAPALHGYYQGADTVYTKALGSVAEPAQLLCAEYGWNAAAPGAFALADSGREALQLVERCRSGVETRPEIFARGGLVSRACGRLYGGPAGPWLAQVFSLGVGEGTFPVATGWGTVSREVGRLLRGSADEARERSVYWERREALTGEALALVALALAEPLPDSDVLADVEWLRTCLEVGQRLCRALAAGWKWKGEPTAPALAAAAGAVEDLESYLARHVPTDTTDPVGGDVAVWWATAAQLRALTAPPTQSPPPPAGP